MNFIDSTKTFFYMHYKKIIIICFLIILTIFLIKSNKNECIECNCEYLEKDSVVEKVSSISFVTDEYVYVDVKGEVKKPGVYKMKDNQRVIDVLNKAGLKTTSNTKYINLSKILTDQMVIFIYSNKEIGKIIENKNKVCEVISNNVCYEKEENLDSVYYEENNKNDEVITNLDPTHKEEIEENDENKIININTASKEELMSLTGIGESKAKNIIAYREKNGPFNSIEEIMNVSGIGNSLFEGIKENITV